jgi:hypothetical protein
MDNQNGQNYIVPEYYNSYYIQEENQMNNRNGPQPLYNHFETQTMPQFQQTPQAHRLNEISIQHPEFQRKVIVTNQKDDVLVPMILFITGFFFHICWPILFCMYKNSKDKTIRAIANSGCMLFCIVICFPLLGVLLMAVSYVFLYILSIFTIYNVDVVNDE